mgnify:CR=1 FL=1
MITAALTFCGFVAGYIVTLLALLPERKRQARLVNQLRAQLAQASKNDARDPATGRYVGG